MDDLDAVLQRLNFGVDDETLDIIERNGGPLIKALCGHLREYVALGADGETFASMEAQIGELQQAADDSEKELAELKKQWS